MRRAALFLPLLAAVLAGCAPAVVVRPLYDSSEKAPADERIQGEWITPDVGESGLQDKIFLRWTVGAYDQSDGYPVTMRSLAADKGKDDSDSDKEDTATDYQVRLLPIGDKLFFAAEFQKQQTGTHGVSPSDLSPGLIPAKVIGRLWIQQDFLRVALLDSEWVTKNTPESSWVKMYGGDEQIAAITAPAEEVRALLTREADNHEAFSIVLHFCRPGAACAVKAAEDELARFPNDTQTLKDSAGLYLRKGNYASGVSLRRHLVELDPKDANSRGALGDALLLNREFEAARREFLAADQLIQAKNTYSPYAFDLTYSYFLEGNYAEVVKASAKYLTLDYPDPIIILLRHVALLRLGRTTEAQATLEKSVASFKGSWESHFLLLEFQSRIVDAPPMAAPPSEAKDLALRRTFFRAMRFAANGDKTKAASAFQEVVGTANRDNLLYLAAQIELERLNPSSPH
jgi:tetratricopeptide (TPR) repeat protein